MRGEKRFSHTAMSKWSRRASTIRIHLRYQARCRPADNAPARRSNSIHSGDEAGLSPADRKASAALAHSATIPATELIVFSARNLRCSAGSGIASLPLLPAQMPFRNQPIINRSSVFRICAHRRLSTRLDIRMQKGDTTQFESPIAVGHRVYTLNLRICTVM